MTEQDRIIGWAIAIVVSPFALAILCGIGIAIERALWELRHQAYRLYDEVKRRYGRPHK